MGINGYLIYAAFFVSLWSGDMRTGKSVVIACIALLAIETIAVLIIPAVRPASLSGGAPISVAIE